MKRLVHRLHIWLGLIVALPVLAWSLSGFIYSLPSSVEGSKYAAINSDEIRIGPKQAIESARRFAGDELPVSALTLQNRNGRIEYQAVSGVRSILIDAATGEVFDSPPSILVDLLLSRGTFLFLCLPLQRPFDRAILGTRLPLRNHGNLSQCCLLVERKRVSGGIWDVGCGHTESEYKGVR